MTRSRLHDAHLARGAVMAETAGWEMPAHYGDPAAEHRSVRQCVGLADLFHRGKLRVTGDDRVKWLQSVISNDILPLQPGHGLYSSFLNHKGKMLTYFRVYAMADALMLEDVGEIGDATFQALRKFLLYGTKAKMENCAETWGHLLVSGPRAANLIKTAFGVDVSGLKSLDFVGHEIDGRQALLIRTEETGEMDFEVLLPVDGLIAAWSSLTKAGAPMGLSLFGTQARESLRLEAGLARVGKDLTEEIVPPEANLEGIAFSLSKGCYPGQEVVARMDTYGSVRRRLVGLTLKGSTVPPHGAKLFSGDREVGWVSSSALSPTL
ncbi:MAG: aminomethyltransferase family protein, partial [Nitrospirota bacterium]|nr:aminomethyltransferase family protein [Nitrospirota bacterium]